MYKSLKEVFGKKKSHGEIFAPMNGTCVPMSQVKEPTFSHEILGRGVAIIPCEGKVTAPEDGEILMVFETRHAVSIRTNDGAELIIHIGLETVNLHGEYFTAHVKAGDKVKKGDLLIEFDMDKIKEQGYDLITPIVICNTPDYPNLVCHTGMEVKAGDLIIELGNR